MTSTQEPIDRLLSDEELKWAMLDILKDDGIKLSLNGTYLHSMHNLINTQKRLYAESVIGEDVPLHGSEENMGMIAAVNGKLAQQRKLINGDKI